MSPIILMLVINGDGESADKSIGEHFSLSAAAGRTTAKESHDQDHALHRSYFLHFRRPRQVLSHSLPYKRTDWI